MTTLTGPLADGAVAADSIKLTAATAYVDAWSLSEAWLPTIIPGGVAGGKFSITESFALKLNGNATVTERVTFASVIKLLQGAIITDGFSVNQSLVAWVNALLKSGLKMRDIFTPSFVFNLTVAQTLKIVEALDVRNSISFADTLFVRSSVPTYAFIAGVQVFEALSLMMSLKQNLVLRLAFNDVVRLTDRELLNFIYRAEIHETIVAEIIYQSPNGNVSTWAINTRTNAVTEYSNFNFNSYATMGRKYLAADADGLYELNGPRDVTTDVIARFGGGYFQPNSAKFSGLKGVYLGMTGEGNYILKIITGDGITRAYRAALNPGLMTTKVNVGKGVRARYIAWELTNENGQDFDFDQIEFVPMMGGRRV